MPRAKAAAKEAAKKPKAQKGHKLAEKFPMGEVMKDLCKKKWVLGDVIGQGGFGLIYLASKEDDIKSGSAAEYVIKIEPKGNGPLFCEVHFYTRVAKADLRFLKSKKLKYLGVPRFIASGHHVYKSTEYRFMVMQRFGTDLQKVFENAGKCFSKQTVFALGLRMIDALEYLHENNYIHGDIKAANCLLGFKNGKEEPDVVYLVDFGLACKYQLDGVHKVLKEDPRKAHDGTIEFTSIDAHKGIEPARRGDMEILGYCLLQWLCGTLPWEDKLTDKNYVRDSKIRSMSDIPTFMKKCFPSGNVSDEIAAYLTAVKKLEYDEKPNYDKLRDIFSKGLGKLSVKDTWKLALPLSGKKPRSPSPKKPRKTPLKATDKPGSAVKTRPGRPGTPKGAGKPSSPKKVPTPKPRPTTPVPRKTGKKTVATKRTVTPKAKKPVGNNIIPGLRTGTLNNAIAPAARATARQARSPVSTKGVKNGTGKRSLSPATSPAPKKRKVVRKRNAHLVEMACQTSPGLKQNK